MRGSVVLTAIALASACTDGFTPMPGPPSDTETTREAGPTPIPTPVTGSATVLVTDQWTERPAAGVTVFATFEDSIVDEAVTDSSGQAQLLVVDGGELTAVHEPEAVNVSLFGIERGGSYHIHRFNYDYTPQTPPIQLTVHGLVLGQSWNAGIGQCQTFGNGASTSQTKLLQPMSFCVSAGQTSFDVVAVQNTRAGFAYAVALGTTALEITIDEPMPQIHLTGTLPAWEPPFSDGVSSITAGSIRDGHCSFTDRVSPIPTGDFGMDVGVATSADQLSFSIYYNGSAGNERAARIIRDPAGAIDVAADFERIVVPPLPSFDTSAGIEASWSPLASDENIVIYSSGPGFYHRLSFLPAGSTHARIPQLPSDTGLPSYFGFGVFIFDDGASHFEYGRLRDCRRESWHAYNGFVSAAF